jgi:tetratricopeptide (TPR) repeat protein
LRINENSIQALNISSVVLRGLGRISESIENSKKMLTIDENVPTALYNLSHILSKQEKYPEALKHITRFMDLNIAGPGIPTEKAKKLRDKLIEQNESK